MSKFKVALIEAEEAYLKVCGWTRVETNTDPDEELLTVWSNPGFTLQYSRNQAIQICKSTDPELGIW